MAMRSILVAAALLALRVAANTSVLFIGDSLTHRNNLPKHFLELCAGECGAKIRTRKCRLMLLATQTRNEPAMPVV
jgi:hypothetical protein